MNYKVLLVEDERTLSGIVRDALETMDFSVEMAYDGSEGLRRYFEIRPDILVVDVMMPKMSGFDMVKAIRQSDKETPILFLTAKTTVDDVVTGFNLGADDYLKKPFAIPELVVRMKTLLGRSGKKTPDQEKGQASYNIGEYLFTPESATLLHKPTGESTLIPRRGQHHPHPEHPPVTMGRRRLLQRPQPPGPHHPPPPPLLPRPPHPDHERQRHRLQTDSGIKFYSFSRTMLSNGCRFD